MSAPLYQTLDSHTEIIYLLSTSYLIIKNRAQKILSTVSYLIQNYE